MAQLKLEAHHYECLNTDQLTAVYNTVLDRKTKKLSQKSAGVQALEEYFAFADNNIEDHLANLPKEVINLWKANGLDIPANQNTPFSKAYKAEKVNPEGKFTFNTRIGIGEYIRKIIVGTVEERGKVNGLLNPDAILVEAKKRFPESRATSADVAFQKSELRKQGYEVPIFRRTRD